MKPSHIPAYNAADAAHKREQEVSDEPRTGTSN